MKVLQIKPCANISIGLKNIVEQIESGDIEGDDCTLIIGDQVFHLGMFDDSESAVRAIWNMTYGINKLMSTTIE